MKTLVTDDFDERPRIPVDITYADGTTSTLNATSINIITTGGYVAGDPPPPELYRTQAFVDKRKEIES